MFVLRHLIYRKESKAGVLISPFSLNYGHLKQSESKIVLKTTICSRLCESSFVKLQICKCTIFKLQSYLLSKLRTCE